MNSDVAQWADEPIHFYAPSPKQAMFHISPAKVRAFFGANQSGKTWSSVLETSWAATGLYPDWYPMEGRLKQPTRGRILVKDFEKGFQEVLMPWLDHFLPQRFVKRKKHNSQGIPSLYELTNGSTISIVTCRQSPGDLAGWTGDYACADEPFPRAHYVELFRGLMKRNGRFWMTLTPLEEEGGFDLWIFDEIYQHSTMFDPDSYIDCYFVDIREGFLTEDQIALFESTLTLDEKTARLHGQFLFQTGLVYKEMQQPGRIVIDPFEIPKNWTRYCICDPHDRAPTYFTYLAVNPEGAVYLYDEIVLKDMTFKQMSEQVLVQEHGPVYLRIIDPRSGYRKSATSGTTPADEFAMHGLYFIPAPGDRVGVGHKKVKEWFDEGKFFIFRNCRDSIHMFQHYVWPRHKPGTEGAPKERPTEQYKHIPDNVRYAALYGISYVPPPAPKDYREPPRKPETVMTYDQHWMRA